MKGFLAVLVVALAVHFGLVEIAALNVGACGNAVGNAVCACIKSGMRQSFTPELLVLGRGQAELYEIMAICKA
jgi:hypothetical protein